MTINDDYNPSSLFLLSIFTVSDTTAKYISNIDQIVTEKCLPWCDWT